MRNRFSCLAGGSLPGFFRFRLFRVSLSLLLLLFKVMLLASKPSVVLWRSCCLLACSCARLLLRCCCCCSWAFSKSFATTISYTGSRRSEGNKQAITFDPLLPIFFCFFSSFQKETTNETAIADYLPQLIKLSCKLKCTVLQGRNDYMYIFVK